MLSGTGIEGIFTAILYIFLELIEVVERVSCERVHWLSFFIWVDKVDVRSR